MLKKVSATDMFLASQKKSFSFSIESALLSLATPVSRIYSDLLEQPVNPRQTLHLLHVQLAVLMLLLPIGAHLSYYAIAALWCALALNGCVKAFSRQKS